jgi:ABC-type glycerol-3-phosphate transport system substrate-binding protein
MGHVTRIGATLGAALALAGCLSGSSGPGGGTANSGGKRVLQFWHTRRADQEVALKGICADYNAANPQVEIQPSYQGSYDRLNQKIRASIQAKGLPALAVGYESHVTEYAKSDVLVPLDDLIKDPELGIKPEELADIPERYLESNRFAQFENKLLSFPFTKSNLVLYYNKTLLKQAGFETPPATWDEFEKQAAAVTARIKKPAFVFDSDPSTIDGIIYSFGGELLGPDGKTTLFDKGPTVKTLDLLQRMAKAKSLQLGSGDDVSNLFAAGQCALILATTSGRAAAEEQIGSTFEWDVSVIPHAAGVEPVTVMYGPNVCIFRSTPEQEREAWKFIRFFVSPEITARWARETGYLPVRKSSVELPEMKSFYERNERARHVYDILQYARPEPNVLGWQEVRNYLTDASNAVIAGKATPLAAASQLKQKSDRALAESE